jgi:murein tripeptide amidase MpaA
MEIEPRDFKESEKDLIPIHKFKKYIIVAARVHPGESNASYIMQGFIKFITGNSPEAADLRRRVVFKVIPMTNPDGVIAGNYRTSLSGNDLNRCFLDPNPRLHPTVCAIKKLVRDILAQAKEPEPIQ